MKKKLNQLDPAAITSVRLIGHADPVTGKMNRGTVAQLLALFTANTPVKTYANEAALLANTDLVIGYLALVSDTGTLYLYNGPAATDIGNYTEVGGGTEHFKGVYISDSSLTSSVPSAAAGDYAYVDQGIDYPVELWIWDDDDNEWVQSGGGIPGGVVQSVTGNGVDNTDPENPIVTGITREFNRTFTDTLIFDKNEIFSTPFELTGNVVYELGGGGLVDQPSVYRQRFITDGTKSISFGAGFDFLYPEGFASGYVPPAGTYEIYFLHTNGSVTVNFPGVTSEDSSIVTLLAPENFAAVADGENAIDLSWDDVANESSYLIEFSLTGTGGWSTLSTPAAGATTSTQTGLNPGDQRFYRIKAIGDGVNFLDSPFSTASATTEDSGDVLAPTFIFLPAAGNTDWPVNKVITITANEAIQNTDGTPITDANVATRITLKETNSGGTNIPFSASIDVSKTIITITPTTIYGDTQLVYVAINNVEDVSGNEVTVAVSATFTTTDYTLMNGTSNRLHFGDNSALDSLFTAPDTNFWLECTIKNHSLSGSRVLWAKYSTSDNQRSFYWNFTGADVTFTWYTLASGLQSRSIKWTGVLDGSEQVLVLKYDGSIDTNDGLDRLTLLIDGVTAGSKTLSSSVGALGNIVNTLAFLSVGVPLDHLGTPVGTSYFSGEIKDSIIRSNSGATVELNVPIVRTGTDTSGNARNGTWV